MITKKSAIGKYIQVIITTEKREEAEKIGKEAVKRRLAACVQVLGPIRSFYWWKGEIAVSDEWLCFIKTTEEKYSELEQLIRKLHSYEIPEIIALPIVHGLREYLTWIAKETGS